MEKINKYNPCKEILKAIYNYVPLKVVNEKSK